MKTSHGFLVAVLVVAFGLRLAAGWVWQSRLDQQRFGMGDTETYWSLAATIAQGLPYEYGTDRAQVFRTPGYPLLLAPIIGLAGDGPRAIMLARAEAALFGVLAVWCLWWLTRLLFDERAALLAAALASVYPGAIALSAMLLSEAPFCPLMLLQLVLSTLAWQAASSRKIRVLSFVAGLVAAAATLVRPSWLLFTPLAVAAIFWADRVGGLARAPSLPRRHAMIASWMLFGLALGMSPWWIRNACVTGRFVPTTLQVGASLYDGLNPNADGSSNMDFVHRFAADEKSRALEHPGESLEQRLDRRMKSEAMAWAKEHPGKAFWLAGVKFRRMWNLWPNEPRLASWPVALAVFFTYTPLLLFAIMGAWRTIRQGWPYVLCWLPAVYLTLLHVVFVSSIRYREPAMLALLALAAGALHAKIGSRKTSRMVASEGCSRGS